MKLAGLTKGLLSALRPKNTGKATTAEQDSTKRGIACLESNDFVGARKAFEEALQAEPGVAARHVNLSFSLQQLGAGVEAVYHLQRAVGLEPDSFDARYMLGCEHERAGDLDDAAIELRHAVRLKPGFTQAYADLGRVLAANADPKGARDVLEAGLAQDDRHGALHLYLGNVCMEEQSPGDAEQCYRWALALQPAAPEVLANLGRALHAQQDYPAALQYLDRALVLSPASAQIRANRGITLKALGRLDEAAAALRAAIEVDPDHADALNNLGIVLSEQGRLDEAIDAYRRAIALRPDMPGAYGNLGLALYQRGNVADAVVVYRQGLAIRPIAEIHDNFGIALQKQGAVDEAIEHYHLALALQPDNINTRCNLAAALAEGGAPKDAIAAYRQILSLEPEHLVAHSNLLFNLSVDPDTRPQDYLEEARRFEAKLVAVPLPPRTASREQTPLRVGLVSADLRGHPVGYFLEGVIHHLDPQRFELYGYPTIAQEDELTARIRPLFKGWRMLKGLDDEAAARAIRSDGVDILIDLSGHTADNRLPVFAWRPAPLQVAWLGYFASTGLSCIDFVLADPLCVPPGNDGQFSEKVWRVPETRLCFTPPAPGSTPDVRPLPALQSGHLTFGCFQRLPKINDAVLGLWGRVFAAIPDARLLLQSHQTGRALYAGQILARLEGAGIARHRVDIRGPAHRSAYLQSYGDVDIVLDTFPYTGGTTTCEALWMGVPTLTLAGETMIARQGVAMLGAARLPEWVAADGDAYVANARRWAGNLPALGALRSSLRQRLPDTPLFDPAHFAVEFGRALQGMWRTHVAG